jgi:transcriptional regulator with PAS, ATPase and Fis domain
LTPSLVEGQLFGFVKGAYSGAQRDDPGFVRRAQGGTLLLDEIPDLPIEMQAKLLRVIQENEIVPLGTTRSERIDVRFLAATQTSLGTLVSAERFREDLHARLNRDVIELPPLRERKEDLGMLIAEILRRQGVTDDDGLSLAFRSTESLLRYRWPHNVRELVDKVLGARAAAKGGVLRPEVPGAANPVDGSPPLAGTSAHPSKDERERMVALLEKHKGNASAVAREIGRSRTWVYHLLHRFQLLPGPFRRRRK